VDEEAISSEDTWQRALTNSTIADFIDRKKNGKKEKKNFY